MPHRDGFFSQRNRQLDAGTSQLLGPPLAVQEIAPRWRAYQTASIEESPHGQGHLRILLGGFARITPRSTSFERSGSMSRLQTNSAQSILTVGHGVKPVHFANSLSFREKCSI
jgi:hypothetical protein